MISLRPLVLVCALASVTGGCATVAVYEPVDAAEFTFAQPNADLRIAADQYCETARDRGLARGESTIGGLAGVLLGNASPAEAYWAAIDGDAQPTERSIARIRSDLDSASAGLNNLIVLAVDVVESGSPRRTDVSKFESALIHARQSKQSLGGAVGRIRNAGGDTASLSGALETLDDVITQAVAVADRLAEARVSREIS